MSVFIWNFPLFAYLIWNLFFKKENRPLFNFGFISFFILLYTLIAFIGLVGILIAPEELPFEVNRLTPLSFFSGVVELSLPILLLKHVREGIIGFWLVWLYLFMKSGLFDFCYYKLQLDGLSHESSWTVSGTEHFIYFFNIDSILLLLLAIAWFFIRKRKT